MVAYKGIDDILSISKYKNIKISIVSSSPLSYVHRVILHSFIEASHRLKIVEKDCWAVGDHPNDIVAAKRAGMFSVGAA